MVIVDELVDVGGPKPLWDGRVVVTRLVGDGCQDDALHPEPLVGDGHVPQTLTGIGLTIVVLVLEHRSLDEGDGNQGVVDGLHLSQRERHGFVDGLGPGNVDLQTVIAGQEVVEDVIAQGVGLAFYGRVVLEVADEHLGALHVLSITPGYRTGDLGEWDGEVLFLHISRSESDQRHVLYLVIIVEHGHRVIARESVLELVEPVSEGGEIVGGVQALHAL